MNRIFKVLIVDDEPIITKLIGMVLPKSKYSPIFAFNGTDAIRKTLTEKPDLIILDLCMPDIDGMEVLQILKNNSDTRLIPVIICSAIQKISAVEKSFNSGAVHYLFKPLDYNKVCKKADAILKISQNNRKAA